MLPIWVCGWRTASRDSPSCGKAIDDEVILHVRNERNTEGLIET
jgi:hypothetical protein